MEPTPRSLVLDLLSTLRRGTMPVAALIEAGALFGLPGNNVRVALARLLAEGYVARDERGRYRLGPKADPISRTLANWRHPERAIQAWKGAWILVRTSLAGSRAERRGRERSMRLLGFAALERDLFTRPANLIRDAAGIREDLQSLGLPATDMVFEARDFDAATERRARSLWDVDRIEADHHALRERILQSGARLGTLAVGEAMVESFVLGGEALRALVLDPRLPEEICPSDGRRALTAAMRRYDELGRSAWARFLARYDVPHRETPIDTRLVVPATAA